MPAMKDPSVRARRNKSASKATLERKEFVNYASWSLDELRDEIRSRNADRLPEARILLAGNKPRLVSALSRDDSPIPPMPDPPRIYIAEGRGEHRVVLVDEAAWHDNAVKFWEDVWSSPMEGQWDDSDIHNVYILVGLVNDYWYAPGPRERAAAAAEIRQQRQSLGLSPYDRRRLEWTIAGADEAKDRATERRKRQQDAARAQSSSQAQPKAPEPGSDPRTFLAVAG